MKVLLDTHIFLWFVLDDLKLSSNAKATIQSPQNAILVSPASHWEIAIKISVGKFRLNRSYEEFWETAMRENDIRILPIELRHTSKLVSLPWHHKDPFDRLLAAQALAEQIPLISGDARFDAYGVDRLH